MVRMSPGQRRFPAHGVFAWHIHPDRAVTSLTSPHIFFHEPHRLAAVNPLERMRADTEGARSKNSNSDELWMSP